MADRAVLAARTATAIADIDDAAQKLGRILGFEWDGLPPIHVSHPDVSRVERWETVAAMMQELVKRIAPARVEAEDKPKTERKRNDKSGTTDIRPEPVLVADNGYGVD